MMVRKENWVLLVNKDLQACLENLAWTVLEAPRETLVNPVPLVETVLVVAQVQGDHPVPQAPWLRAKRCQDQPDHRAWMVPQVFQAYQDLRENVVLLVNVVNEEKTECLVIVVPKVCREKRVAREMLVFPELREIRVILDQLVRLAHLVCRDLLD